MVVRLVLALLLTVQSLAAATRTVRLDPGRAALAAEVSDRFVSFAVDVDQLVGGTFWDPAGGPAEVRVPAYDFARPQLRALAAALAPAYLRLGGSASDVTFYDLTDPPRGAAPAPFQERLTAEQWDAAVAFARQLGFEIILTVNAGAGPRDVSGTWTADNARVLLERAAAGDAPVTVLEFGNELNLFGIRAGLSGYTPARYATDLAAFVALRDAWLPGARIGAPGNIFMRTQDEDIISGFVFGPRTAEVLPLVAPHVDIVEYHYYAAISTRCPPAGPRVDASTALDPAYLDGIDEPVALVSALRDTHAPGRPLWLTESGGQSCGGQMGVGDRFVNTFWYLNTLGRLARAGQEVFVRQTLSGSTYGLIDDVTLAPRPDYWAALLWRRTMGRRALALARGSRDPELRVFAHCARDGGPGAVTLLALNTSRTRSIKVRLRHTRSRRPGRLYLVTAPDVAGTAILLNGTPLAPAPDGAPPTFASVPAVGRVVLPPTSWAFIEIPDAGATACPGSPR